LRTSPIKVFLDSSVLFSAFFSSTGSARDLLTIAEPTRVELWISEVVLAETRRNLTRKGQHTVGQFEQQIATGSFFHADPPGALILAVARVIEPKDAPIVAGAISAGADFLATYDRAHLLTQAELIHDHFGLEVATPHDVLDVIVRKTP
jgi:predicted nucleic acid-binding protein